MYADIESWQFIVLFVSQVCLDPSVILAMVVCKLSSFLS